MRKWRAAVSSIFLAGLVNLLSTPVSAQSEEGSEGGALGDTIVWALKEALETIFDPLESIIERHANDVIEIIVGTPHPNRVFSEPTNSYWPDMYAYFWDNIIPLSLFLWALMIGLVIFFESTSHLFSSYHRTKLKRRAFAGLLGILSWWWIDALSRQFIQELSIFLSPDLSEVELFETLSFGTLGALMTAVTLSVDFTLFVLVVLIYFIREMLLNLFTLIMPILIVLWIPGVGPFRLVSEFMKRLAGFYAPFLFMTIPVVFLFRIAQILGSNFSISLSGIGAWLTALVLPIVAILSPLLLIWQAGSIFSMAHRASSHVSARRARSRLSRTNHANQSAVHGGRNFARGVRGKAAVKRNGQFVLGSGDSRAHAAGSRLNQTATRLRGSLAARSSGDTRTSENSTNEWTRDTESAESDSHAHRSRGFETLREPSRTGEESSRQSDRDTIDDEPRYIR